MKSKSSYPGSLLALLPLFLSVGLLTVTPAIAQPPGTRDAATPIVGGQGSKLDDLARTAQVRAELASDATTWQGFDQLSDAVRQNLINRDGLEPLTSAIGRANVRANNPAGDQSNDVQCQVTVAASGPNVVAVWLDSKQISTSGSETGFAWSCDYGQNFTDGGELSPPFAGDQPTYAMVASDGNGTFYLLVDVYNRTNDTDKLYFYKGQVVACGFGWTGQYELAGAGSGLYFNRIAIAADPADAHVYAAWSHDAGGSSRKIEVRASSNGGTTWGPVTIAGDDSADPFKGYDFPRLAIGPNHELYVSWTNTDGDYHWCDLSDNAGFQGHFVYVNRSFDFGQTWGTQTNVRGFYSNYYTSGPGDFWSWLPVVPSLAVDRSSGPYNGRLYLTWPEPAPWGALGGNNGTTTEAESNNVPATATPVPLGNDIVGTAAANNDPDYFQLTLTAGQPVFLQLEPEGNAGCFAGTTRSFFIRLYPTPTNLNATPLTLLAASAGNSYLSRIVFTPRWSGTYYLRAQLRNSGVFNVPYIIKTRSMAGRFPAPSSTYPMRDEGDIVSIHSSDGGLTWTDRTLVNWDAPVGYPENRAFAVVNSDGRVCILWQDMRETPASPPPDGGVLTDIYMAESTDGGATWSAGQRMTDASGPYSGLPRMSPNIGFWGVSAAATDRSIYAGWPDGRNASTVSGVDVYTNLLDYTAPTVQIESGPADASNPACAPVVFTWSGHDGVHVNPVDFQYAWKFDGGAYSPFGSDRATPALAVAVGNHTFSVKARDAFGHESPEVTRTFLIGAPPVPALTPLPTVTGLCSATVTAPTATDACGQVVVGTTADPTSYSSVGSYTVHWSYSDGIFSTQQTQDVVVNDSGLQILNPPVAFAGCPGTTATLSVTASSLAPISYRWRQKAAWLSDGPTPGGSVISGANGPVLTISDIGAGDAGLYDCQVSDACGNLMTTPVGVTVQCSAPTPAGPSVPVALGSILGLTFDQVDGSGTTSVNVEPLTEAFPAGADPIPRSAPAAYDISTTALVSGDIEVCVTYDPAQVTGNPAGVQLYHKDDSLIPPAWVNITTSQDLPNHRVCGRTTHLSPFVLAETDNQITPGPAPSCISQAHPCITIPVRIERGSAVPPIRAFSLEVSLSANLALCGPGIVEGPYLKAANPVTAFQVVGAASPYTVDGAILGLPCGATALTGDLFYINVARVGPLTGTGTISVSATLLRDCNNGVVVATPGDPLSITIDAESPAAVTNLAAAQVKSGNGADGRTNITLSFTPPGDAAVVEVYRAPWGGYPEYDDAGFTTPPAVPTYPPGSPWAPTAVTTSGQSDEPPDRDFWYYVVFTKDACGNVSAVSNRTGGTLDYHLGDTHNSTTDCVGDNEVNTSDVSFLGGHYGATLGFPDPLACLDVGPTTNGSVDARPTTDNRLQFEDLILFAMNYSQVSAPAPPPMTGGDGASTLALRTERASSGIVARLELSAGGNLQGVSVDLAYDAAVVRPVEVVPGELLARQGGGSAVLSSGPGNVDVVALGAGARLSGSGELAMMHFEVIGPGEPGIALRRSEGRDTDNRPVSLIEGGRPGEARPTPAIGLRPAYPNPFHGSQRLVLSLPVAGPARLRIFDVAGHLVRTLVDGIVDAGESAVEWDGRDGSGRPVASGLYLARLEAGGRSWTRHLLKAE